MRLPTVAFATLAVLSCAGTALAQQPPIPSAAEIKKKIREAFPKLVEQAEVVTVTFGEDDAITINYKKIPTDPKEIAKAMGKELGTDKLPDNMVDQYIGMFADDIAEVLNEHLADIGELVNKKVIKIKSKKIPVGKHRIGLVFKGEKPAGLIVFDKKDHAGEDQEKLKKPILIKLKTKSSEMNPSLVLELKEPQKPKKGKVEMDIFVSALRYVAKTTSPVEIEAAPESE